MSHSIVLQSGSVLVSSSTHGGGRVYTRSTKVVKKRKKRSKNKALSANSYGLGHRERTKVSRYADRGYRYEVRFLSVSLFVTLGHKGDTPIDRIVASLRRHMVCRVVAHREGHFPSLTVYLREDADLFQLRLLFDRYEIFRVYRLTSPSAASETPSPDPACSPS